MKKNTNLCVDLKTVMQNDAILKEGKCYRGLLTRNSDDHFLFEETIHKGSSPRNPKLHDGKYLSMVRMQNGKYQFHMKTLQTGPDTDAYEVAHEVANEILQGFQIINA